MISNATLVRQTWRNLLAHKLRSFLAVLGVLIGSAAVVALVSSGQMATQSVIDQFSALGTNLISVSLMESYQGTQSAVKQTQLDRSQLQSLQTKNPAIEVVAPLSNFYASASYRGKSLSATALGADQALQQIGKLKLAVGRFVNQLDRQAAFCVIGSAVAKALLQQGLIHPLGAQLKLGDRYFTIIGVLAPTEGNFFIPADLNQSIVVPLEAGRLVSDHVVIHDVIMRFDPKVEVKPLQQRIEGQLKAMLSHQRLFFRNPEQLIANVTKQKRTFSWLLGAIGGVSLLVGGIGIMNIMLVSVIERRREIGVRMAVGSRAADITRLFVCEAVVLSLVGGVLGVLLGLGAAWMIAELAGWPLHWFMTPPLLGFSVSALVGVFFGWYPAHQAAQLAPIEVLREE